MEEATDKNIENILSGGGFSSLLQNPEIASKLPRIMEALAPVMAEMKAEKSGAAEKVHAKAADDPEADGMEPAAKQTSADAASLAAGLLTPTDGRVLCTAKRIACAFQESRLFPWLTVAQNLSAVLPKPDPRAIAEALWAVELSDCAALYPAEPFSALDADLRRRLSDRLRVKWKQAGAAVLLVTHQQEDAERLGGRVLRL